MCGTPCPDCQEERVLRRRLPLAGISLRWPPWCRRPVAVVAAAAVSGAPVQTGAATDIVTAVAWHLEIAAGAEEVG